MKKSVQILCIIGIISLFNACSAGYVSEQPTYQDSYRPSRPSSNHIWIEGNWYWDNRTRSYNHRDGNWSMPRQGRNYEQGHWAQTRRGYRWVPGGWR